MTSAPFGQPAARRNVFHVDDFRLFGGLHCETSALRKVLGYFGRDFAEEFLFGMAGGIGFVFWQQAKAAVPFVGGRNGNFPDFIQSLGTTLGYQVRVCQTRSARRAYIELTAELQQSRPVVCYGDIHHLPYFHTDRHFTSHAFVVYAVDELNDRVWISDRAEHPRVIRLCDLADAWGARSSPHRSSYARLGLKQCIESEISAKDIWGAIQRSYQAMCEPPISAFGLPGIRRFGGWLRGSLAELPPEKLCELLVSLYINLELAGTGGNAFRSMYRQFLIETKRYINCDTLDDAIEGFGAAVKSWSVFIDGLLPPMGTASTELKKQILMKERAFENAHTDETDVGAHHAQRIAELLLPAGEEFGDNRTELIERTHSLDQVIDCESLAFQELQCASVQHL